MNRKQDERDYRPSFWVLNDDLTVVRHEMDVSQDLWIEPEQVQQAAGPDVTGLMAELEQLGGDSLDFSELLRRAAESEDEDVRKLTIEALDGGREDASR